MGRNKRLYIRAGSPKAFPFLPITTLQPLISGIVYNCLPSALYLKHIELSVPFIWLFTTAYKFNYKQLA